MKVSYDYRCHAEADELIRYLVHGMGAQEIDSNIGWAIIEWDSLDDEEGILAELLLQAVASGVSITHHKG